MQKRPNAGPVGVPNPDRMNSIIKNRLRAAAPNPQDRRSARPAAHRSPRAGIARGGLERPVIEKVLTHLGLDLQPPPRGRAREAGQAFAT